MCHRLFPIRRLMQARTNRSPALSCAMTRSRSLLTLIFNLWSGRTRYTGSTLPIRNPKGVVPRTPLALGIWVNTNPPVAPSEASIEETNFSAEEPDQSGDQRGEGD